MMVIPKVEVALIVRGRQRQLNGLRTGAMGENHLFNRWKLGRLLDVFGVGERILQVMVIGTVLGAFIAETGVMGKDRVVEQFAGMRLHEEGV